MVSSTVEALRPSMNPSTQSPILPKAPLRTLLEELMTANRNSRMTSKHDFLFGCFFRYDTSASGTPLSVKMLVEETKEHGKADGNGAFHLNPIASHSVFPGQKGARELPSVAVVPHECVASNQVELRE